MPVPKKWFGFKLVRPPKGNGLTQSLLQSCELDALRTCLSRMVKEESETTENKVRAQPTARSWLRVATRAQP